MTAQVSRPEPRRRADGGAGRKRADPRPRPKSRAEVLAIIRRRAKLVNARMPDQAARSSLAGAGRPELAAALTHSVAALRIAADPVSSDQLVLSTLNTVKLDLDQYTQSDEAGGDDSDCTRGCDENLQRCIEHWATIGTGDDFSLDPVDDEQQNPGSVGGTDDNPLDVENDDPGAGTGTDDDDSTHHGDEPDTADTVVLASTVLCTMEFLVCNAACLIPG
jgi:hypothetical protein